MVVYLFEIAALLLGGAGALSSKSVEPGRVIYQSNSITRRHIVVVAHQDDWQLFMGDMVAGWLQAGDSSTFIYLTAGDNGRDSLYWQARERAALQSTRIALGVPLTGAELTCEHRAVGNHSIRRCQLGVTESYFLRLPDGRRNGAGFARYGRQSLRKLRMRTIPSVVTVDGSATYNGWADLVGTLRQLTGTGDISGLTVHTTDPSVAINPHDHFDHRLAGFLVADARRNESWATRYYLGYALGTRAANRSNEQVRQKTAVFTAYDNAMKHANVKWSAYAEHPAFYSQCMVRTYSRRASGARPSRKPIAGE